MKKKNFKKGLISAVATGIACVSIITMAGCGLFGNKTEKTTAPVVEETIEKADLDILKDLAENEALVDTKVEDDKIIEYFTDGTFVENFKNESDNTDDISNKNTDSVKEDNDVVQQGEVEVNNTSDAKTNKVVVHTPKEEVIRDKEGFVRIADININTDKQNLTFTNNKIVIQEKISENDMNENSEAVEDNNNEDNNENNVIEETIDEANTLEATENNNTENIETTITPVEEKIVDVEKITENDIEYTITEYEKDTYDEAFEERETFIEHAKDTDEKIAEVINKDVNKVVEDIKKKEEEAKKQAEEEAQTQDIKETEVKKDDNGNTVVTGKDNEGNKVEIVTDKNGNTEVKKTDESGNTTTVAPVIANNPTTKATEAPKPTQTPTTKATEAPKQTQPATIKSTQATTTKATQPPTTQHQHTWKTVHHDAVTHQETYTEKEPYTYEEPYTYQVSIKGYEIYNCAKVTAWLHGKAYAPGDIIFQSENKQDVLNFYNQLYFCKSSPEATWDDLNCIAWRGPNIIREETRTGYETKTGYRDVQKTRTVTDKAAYDEVVCSVCGVHK